MRRLGWPIIVSGEAFLAAGSLRSEAEPAEEKAAREEVFRVDLCAWKSSFVNSYEY